MQERHDVGVGPIAVRRKGAGGSGPGQTGLPAGRCIIVPFDRAARNAVGAAAHVATRLTDELGQQVVRQPHRAGG